MGFWRLGNTRRCIILFFWRAVFVIRHGALPCKVSARRYVEIFQLNHYCCREFTVELFIPYIAISHQPLSSLSRSWTRFNSGRGQPQNLVIYTWYTRVQVSGTIQSVKRQIRQGGLMLAAGRARSRKRKRKQKHEIPPHSKHTPKTTATRRLPQTREGLRRN